MGEAMIPQLSRIAAVLKGAFGFVTANRDPVTGGIAIQVPELLMPYAASTVTIGVVGDSVVQDGYSNAVDGTSMVGAPHYVNWAACYSMGRIRYSNACAVGGWTIDDLLAHIDDRYMADLPDVTVVEIGFNDLSGINNLTDSAGVREAFERKFAALVTKLINGGSLPIIQTISPKNTDMAGFSRTQQKHIYAHNAWRRRFAQKNNLMLFDYANYVADPTDANGGVIKSLFQSSPAHIHGGQEINRALGYELWEKHLSKAIGGSSPVANFCALASVSEEIGPGVNLITNPFLTGATSAPGGSHSGLIPSGVVAWGGGSASAAYSVVASTDKALSSLAGGVPAGNWVQCSIDTSIAGNLYSTKQGVGVAFDSNFSYGGLIQLPQRIAFRCRVRVTELANCAGIFVRFYGSGGGFTYMDPANMGVSPTDGPVNNVDTAFDVLYQTEPFTIPAGWGSGLTVAVGAMITKTAAGTTTFQVSQPELIFLP